MREQSENFDILDLIIYRTHLLFGTDVQATFMCKLFSKSEARRGGVAVTIMNASDSNFDWVVSNPGCGFI
jgi:hypothetical protein